MSLARDKQLALGFRQSALLRLEHYKRVCIAKKTKERILLKALIADITINDHSKVYIKQRMSKFSIWEKSTKTRSRCYVSGRARQVKRTILLARMHMRLNMSEGVLTGLRLRRT